MNESIDNISRIFGICSAYCPDFIISLPDNFYGTLYLSIRQYKNKEETDKIWSELQLVKESETNIAKILISIFASHKNICLYLAKKYPSKTAFELYENHLLEYVNDKVSNLISMGLLKEDSNERN